MFHVPLYQQIGLHFYDAFVSRALEKQTVCIIFVFYQRAAIPTPPQTPPLLDADAASSPFTLPNV